MLVLKRCTMQCLPPEYHHMHHLYRLVGWHQQKMTKTFCSFWDDTETTMKKPGYNICFVPLYCSLTNYECKHSTDCDTLLMTEIAHWVAEEVFFLCKFNKNDACFNMHLQLSLKVFIFPQCGACISVRVLIGEPLLHRWRALTAVCLSRKQALCLDFALRYRQGCRLWEKVIKNRADLS